MSSKKGIFDFKAKERCYTCAWFNAYEAADCSTGECWRFPPVGTVEVSRSSIPIQDQRTVINRPCAEVCGEYQSRPNKVS